jgi:hypothetical protein
MTAEEARGILYGLLRAAGHPVTLEEAGTLLNKPEAQRTELMMAIAVLMFGAHAVRFAEGDRSEGEIPLTV